MAPQPFTEAQVSLQRYTDIYPLLCEVETLRERCRYQQAKLDGVQLIADAVLGQRQHNLGSCEAMQGTTNTLPDLKQWADSCRSEAAKEVEEELEQRQKEEEQNGQNTQ